MKGAWRAALVGAVMVTAYEWVARPYFNTLGATPEELRATYSGDDLVPGGRRGSLMATTIPAPPRDVWPWLVQMGCDRAGFYSWDRLDNGGRQSAERLHPEWQDLAVGDRIASVRDGSTWFDVAVLEPERALVLRASMSLPRPRCFDPRAETPRMFTDGTWGFYLRPTPDGGTRLVVTGKDRGNPPWLQHAGNWLFWHPAHWIMQTKQFAGLRRRARRAPKHQ
jgi:proline iminopeptidase